jgi:isoquinoline 1-oxidoreductase/isoquinoline 1-oxidoreductase beta subunit
VNGPAPRTRRDFLRDSGLFAGSLVVGLHLESCAHAPWGAPHDLAPNAFLRVTPDDRIVFTLARVEMGQGTMTSETMLVAEELGVDPALIEIEFAPNDSAYKNPDYGLQTTGGSNSTKSSFDVLRQAGATVREALLGAAMSELGVGRASLRLEGKAVRELPAGRTLRIGALAERARAFVNDRAPLKPRSEWTLIGRSRVRLDAQAKVDGSAVFGADPDPPGVEVAVVIRGPFGSALEGYDATTAKAMPGVKAVFPIASGVAVVADRYWRARKAAAAVSARWSKAEFGTDVLFADYARRLDQDAGRSARSEGRAEEVLRKSARVITAEYRLPFVAHVAMEPMTATAWVKDDACEVWAPTQSPTLCANVAARVSGISASRIRVHQTLLGGAFGRKSYADAVAEAVEISLNRHAPVRVIWSREDDIQYDMFRPGSLHRVRGAVDGGRALAWSHRLIAQSALLTDAMTDTAVELVPRMFAGATIWAMRTFTTDDSVVEGAADLPYAIENIDVRYQVAQAPIPTGIWRSVGHSFNGFVAETFIDELADALERDPFEFRRELLCDRPRHLGVLERAAKEAGWGTPLPAGRARGIAVHESFGGFVAAVAELSLEGGRPQVHRLVAAVDAGPVVNPDGVRAQIEGGLVFGLSTALTRQEITVKNGRVEQANFNDFEVLRMHQCPEIEVHIVESGFAMSGVGEIGVAVAAPAVANALFRLTGVRARTLPLFT